MIKKHSLKNNFPSKYLWVGVVFLPLIFWWAGWWVSSNMMYVFWVLWLPVVYIVGLMTFPSILSFGKSLKHWET